MTAVAWVSAPTSARHLGWSHRGARAGSWKQPRMISSWSNLRLGAEGLRGTGVRDGQRKRCSPEHAAADSNANSKRSATPSRSTRSTNHQPNKPPEPPTPRTRLPSTYSLTQTTPAHTQPQPGGFTHQPRVEPGDAPAPESHFVGPLVTFRREAHRRGTIHAAATGGRSRRIHSRFGLRSFIVVGVLRWSI